MLSLVPYIIPKNFYKKSSDAVRTSFTMTAARCSYISCVHDSTPLWDLIDTPTTLHKLLSVGARSFTEIDHDATRNVIGVRYATPWPWHVLIPWSSDHVISHPSHLVILVFHIHIIIPMQIPLLIPRDNCRNPHIYSSLLCGFSPIIPSIISSSFYTSSLSLFYFQNLKG
jgi:hypothetical protein